MKHLEYKKENICSWGQQLLSANRFALASEVMNILGYWGTEYAESIFVRLTAYLPIPSHLAN